MELEKHIELAAGVVRDGVPYFERGVFGIRKGTMSVQLADEKKLHLVCGNLVPVELKKPEDPASAETLKKIHNTIHEMRKTWFGI